MIDFIIETDDRYVDLYLRLSRDDKNKGFSVSIENQDKMLTRFARQQHYTVRHRYIDDGESGYSFDRPDFDKLKEDILSGKVKRLLVKDMSRLGRHNAKALLFMEESRDYECEVIALDDGYSNYQDNDSTIGIKTWHNELYVKESSKKVKSVIHMKQEDGEWMSTPPYGYRKKTDGKCELEIEPDNAEIVKRIFQMYANGYGLMKIARILTNEHVPTPSRYLHEQRVKKSIEDNSRYSDVWNDKSIRRILTNETYVGTLIQHKGECNKIRGKYKQLPKCKWRVFKNHHAVIISEELFAQCQISLSNRNIRSKRTKKETDTIFHGLLYCGDCGSLLTPHRTPKDVRIGNTRYYCSKYLKQGKKQCSSKHITEIDLKKAVTIFMARCRNTYKDDLGELRIQFDEKDELIRKYKKKINSCKSRIAKLKNEIKQLIENKMRESMEQPENNRLLEESYQSLITEKTRQINDLENVIEVSQKKIHECSMEEIPIASALEILNEMIAKQDYTKQELQIMFNRIIVHEGHIEFQCNGCFSDNIDSMVKLVEDKTMLKAYHQAILEEIKRQCIDGKFSLMKVHDSLAEKGYEYSYRGVFMKQIHDLEEKGIVIREHKNKRAIFKE